MTKQQVLERGTISRLGHFPRLLIEIAIGPSTEHNFWTGLSCALAEGGVFVATHSTMKLGSLVEVHLALPNDALPIVALARVCMHVPYSSDDIAPGWVLSFVDIEASALGKIRRFVADIRAPLFFDVD